MKLILNKKINTSINNNVEIVPYNKKEHHQIIPMLYAKGFNRQPWHNNWDKHKYINPDGIFLIREKISTTYAGFIISFPKDNYGYISVLTILPQYRNRSYGKYLLKTAINYLYSIGKNKIIIDVDNTNLIALNLYFKLGFVIKK